jgi:hypothetical protein
MSIDFRQCAQDKCVFVKDRLIVVLYVDDLFCVAPTKGEIVSLFEKLRSKYGTITEKHGKTLDYLGMKVDYSVQDEVKITMDNYISRVIEDWPANRIASSPATEYLFRISESEPLSEDERKVFHSMVARLLYLGKRVRPDVLLPIIFLATRVKCATHEDKKKLDRVISYLAGSRNLGLTLSFPRGMLSVQAFIDASFGVHSDFKSHSGSVIKLGAGVVYANSRKQKIVTKSSWEAEVVAVSDSATQMIWVMEFMEELGYKVSPGILWQDNKGAVDTLVKGGSKSAASRHVNIRRFWVKEHSDSGRLQIKWIPTEEMLADGLTKPLQGIKFVGFRKAILNSGK